MGDNVAGERINDLGNRGLVPVDVALRDSRIDVQHDLFGWSPLKAKYQANVRKTLGGANGALVHVEAFGIGAVVVIKTEVVAVVKGISLREDLQRGKVAQIEQIPVRQGIKVVVGIEQLVQRIVCGDAQSCFCRDEFVEFYFVAQGHFSNKEGEEIVFNGLVVRRVGTAFATTYPVDLTRFHIAFLDDHRLSKRSARAAQQQSGYTNPGK